MNHIKDNFNNIINNWNNIEDIDSINKMIEDISSILYSMRIDKSIYNDKLYRSLFNIRGKLYIRKHARKERMKYIKTE